MTIGIDNKDKFDGNGLQLIESDIVEVKLSDGTRRRYIVEWSREHGAFVWVGMHTVWNLLGAKGLKKIGHIKSIGGFHGN